MLKDHSNEHTYIYTTDFFYDKPHTYYYEGGVMNTKIGYFELMSIGYCDGSIGITEKGSLCKVVCSL